MDFAMQTNLLQATEYFKTQMEKVYIHHNCNVYRFTERAHNPNGGKCYYLSTWALMGLSSNDQLIRGQIDLPKRQGWAAEKDYSHGWVLFSYEGKNYVYDPCESHVWPQECWENTFNPHKETFRRTQQELLDEIFLRRQAACVYQIGDYFYQFKSAKDMKLPYDARRNGFLKDTLAGAQIYYNGYGGPSYFLAYDRER